jgi:hypothetical protein
MTNDDDEHTLVWEEFCAQHEKQKKEKPLTVTNHNDAQPWKIDLWLAIDVIKSSYKQ